MKGDFSRLTFRRGKRFTSVRLQQGRVTLDSDWNEQAAIREHLERVRFEDVVGTSGVPCSARENRLYRVELHDGGSLGSASFKWSRDNGSVVFAVTDFPGPESVRLQSRRDPACTLDGGDWVEVGGDDVEQAGAVGTLARIAEIRDDGTLVVLDRDVSRHRGEGPPRIRRWDQRSGATVPVSTDWFELEAGIEVRFSHGEFRSGDYWTVPARPGSRPIEWPEDEPPCGIEHRLCPLALVTWAQAENGWKPMIQDCRRPFSSLTDIHEELGRLQLEIDELRNRFAGEG
jgi:hypothetical protein